MTVTHIMFEVNLISIPFIINNNIITTQFMHNITNFNVNFRHSDILYQNCQYVAPDDVCH